MKFILKHGKSERDMAALRQEIDILRGLSHEHIIKLLDFYETPQEFCLITEFAQGAHGLLSLQPPYPPSKLWDEQCGQHWDIAEHAHVSVYAFSYMRCACMV